ncbi:hypothetical protein CDAR_542261 [Caerostris darwini]|uniref:Uncharacterized protein n=1 Tax=Caerostris darwini TaxID=1538125 RepID=A0AAV4PHS0_9ARAC|nr:hypothetical protein CDAR_542261 [Caerostris darwini]
MPSECFLSITEIRRSKLSLSRTAIEQFFSPHKNNNDSNPPRFHGRLIPDSPFPRRLGRENPQPSATTRLTNPFSSEGAQCLTLPLIILSTLSPFTKPYGLPPDNGANPESI